MTHLPDALCRIPERIAQSVAILLLGTVLAFLIVLAVAHRELARMQGTLRPLIERELSQMIGRGVHIGDVRLQGLDNLLVTNARIASGPTFASGVAMTVPRTIARVDLLSLMLHRGRNPMSAIQRVEFRTPTVTVQRSAEGRWDFQDVLDRLNARPASNAILPARLEIHDGAVAYRDARGFGTKVGAIRQDLVGVNAFLTTHQNNYAFAATAEDTDHRIGAVRVSGSYADRGGAARVAVKANRVAVEALTQFLPLQLPITMENGTAAVRLSALFRALPDPKAARHMSPTALTAEISLSGVGLRLQEMSTPILATSGRLRLVHDRARYPQGSQLEFLDVNAHAGALPLHLHGNITDLNLFDLAHLNPRFNLTLHMPEVRGPAIPPIFPHAPWLRKVGLNGHVALTAHLTGRLQDLHIDGTLRGDHFTVHGLDGYGVTTAFHLQPTARTGPTVKASVRADRARLGGVDFAGLALSISSTTPWRQLEDGMALTGTADATTARLPWGEARDVHGTLSGTPRGITLTDAKARLFDGVVRGTVAVPFGTNGQPRSDALHAFGTYAGIDLSQLGRHLQLDSLRGTGEGTFGIGVNPNGLTTVETHITATDVHFRAYQAMRAKAEVHATSSDTGVTVRIPHATADTPYGTYATVDGLYTSTRGDARHGRLRLPVMGQGIPLAHFAPDQLQGTATMQGVLESDLVRHTLTATVTAVDGTVMGHAFSRGQADLHLTDDAVRLRDVVFDRPGMSLSIPGGTEGFDPRKGMTGLFGTLQLHGASPTEVFTLFGQQLPWSVEGASEGTVDLRFSSSGLIADGKGAVPQATIHVPTSVGDYPLTLDRLGFDFALAGRAMTVRDLQLDRGDTTIHAQGTVSSPHGMPLEASMTFKGASAFLQDLPLDLFGIPLDLAGPLDLHGTLNGVLNGTGANPLAVRVQATSAQLRAEGMPLGRGDVDLTYLYRPEDRQLVITRGGVVNDAFQATSTGRFALSRQRIDGATLAIEHINLGAFHRVFAETSEGRFAAVAPLLTSLPPDLTGHGQATITASGSVARPDVSVDMTLAQLSAAGAPLPNVRARLSAQAENKRYRLTLDDVVADGGPDTGSARLTGSIAPGGELDLRVAATSLNVRALSAFAHVTPITGTANLTGTLRGPYTAPVADADLRIIDPAYGDMRLARLSTHLNLVGTRLTITDGQAWAPNAIQPVTIHGTLPLRWVGFRPQLDARKPVSLDVEAARQNLAPLRAMLPALRSANGWLEGQLHLRGTLTAPRVDGRAQVTGSVGIASPNPKYPNQVGDIDARLRLDSNGKTSLLTVDRLSATLDRVDGSTRVRGFQPGWLSTEGTVRIARREWHTPDRWQWDLNARLIHLPLDAQLFLVPHVSGYLHLTGTPGAPELRGVAYAEHVTVKQPKSMTPGTSQWGPFALDPRLSVVLQVGDGVKLAKSLFRIPLRPSPLPRPDLPHIVPGVLPSLTIDPAQPEYRYNAAMLHPGTAAELPGTWGVITGHVSDPQLYARFEVDKGRLGFPLNLFGSIRRARGHVTYTRASGPRIVMGIPDFPRPTAVDASHPVTSASAVPQIP